MIGDELFLYLDPIEELLDYRIRIGINGRTVVLMEYDDFTIYKVDCGDGKLTLASEFDDVEVTSGIWKEDDDGIYPWRTPTYFVGVTTERNGVRRTHNFLTSNGEF